MNKPRIQERKLGRERASGQCWQGEGLIEVDPRLKAKLALDTLIHEMLHHYCPDWSETRVTRIATQMADVLWRQRFRRICP